jgi:hypothetical protein
MRRSGLGFFIALVMVAVALSSAPAPLWSIDYQDYTPGGSVGGSCSYCSQANCGCASSPNKTLISLCGCSPIDCWRSCSYE